MSFIHFRFNSPVVGYSSLAVRDSGYSKLQRYFKKIPIQTDIVAEEVHPSQDYRPVWREVLELVERQAITALVVPSLFHVAGADVIGLVKVLNFLKAKGVRLKSLTEVIDSSRVSQREIVLRLVRDTQLVASVRGAQ